MRYRQELILDTSRDTRLRFNVHKTDNECHRSRRFTVSVQYIYSRSPTWTSCIGHRTRIFRDCCVEACHASDVYYACAAPTAFLQDHPVEKDLGQAMTRWMIVL